MMVTGKLKLVLVSVCATMLMPQSNALAQAAADPVPPSAAAPQQPVAANGEKKICRVQDVTGSFVRKRKVCRTRAEWERIAADHRTQAQEYVEHGRGGSRGN